MLGSLAGALLSKKAFDWIIAKLVNQVAAQEDEIDSYIDIDQEFKDSCENLGVSSGATVAEIKKKA